MLERLTMAKKKKFQKDPHKIIQEHGRLKFVMEKKVAKGFPDTCASMDKIAAAGARDDAHRRKGIDDYSLSLQTLLNAFDVFIIEYKKGKHSAGWKNNYDLSNPCELTILLFWQIRHTLTHRGGVIDKKCKKKYDKIIQIGLKQGTQPIIDLPTEITEGHNFTISFEDFNNFTKCVFKYIEERVSPEDFRILSARQSFTDIKMGGNFWIDFGFGPVTINLVEAYEKGCDIEPVSWQFITPPGSKYDLQSEAIILPNGDTISAKRIRK